MVTNPRIVVVLALAACSLLVPTAAFAEVPGPPLQLTARVSGSTVTLNWLPPTTGGIATSYAVQASLSPGGPLIASIQVVDTTLTVTAVPNGTFFVRVRGVNNDGLGAASNEVTVIVGPGGCAPNPPWNFVASVAGSTVSLTWSANLEGCAATRFIVQAGSAPGASNLAQVDVGGQTQVNATAPPGTYYLRIVAANASGQSAPSSEVVVTVGQPAPNVTGRWIGVSPDGVIFDPRSDVCDAEDDLQLDLTQTGGALSGTITLTTRAIKPGCTSGQIGRTETVPIVDGIVNGTRVSFRLVNRQGRFLATFVGAVNGNRLSGVVIGSGDGGQVGTFAATRQ